MSEDTIYLRQLLGLIQAALRECTGINLAEAVEKQDQIIATAYKFSRGVIPANEAADIALRVSIEALEWKYRACEELTRLQKAQKEPIQHSPKVDDFIGTLSEEQKSRLMRTGRYGLEISALEGLVVELKKLNDLTMYLTAHIQDYSATDEYRERRQAFLLNGEALEIPTPAQSRVAVPDVILALLGEGLLDDTPVKGKYQKKGDKKDGDIIE